MSLLYQDGGLPLSRNTTRNSGGGHQKYAGSEGIQGTCNASLSLGPSWAFAMCMGGSCRTSHERQPLSRSYYKSPEDRSSPRSTKPKAKLSHCSRWLSHHCRSSSSHDATSSIRLTPTRSITSCGVTCFKCIQP